MSKKLNSQAGFTVLEYFIILIVVGVIGLAGWFVYNHQYKKTPATASSNSAAPAPSPIPPTPVEPAYDVTAKIPSSWVQFLNPRYNLAVSHPADWSVADISDKSKTILNSYKGIKYFSVEFNAPATGTKTYDPFSFRITVTSQALSQAVANDKKALAAQYKDYGSAVMTNVVGTNNYTFKGHQAVLLNTEVKFVNTNVNLYNQDLLILANNRVYDFGTQSQTLKEPLKEANMAAALSSMDLK